MGSLLTIIVPYSFPSGYGYSTSYPYPAKYWDKNRQPLLCFVSVNTKTSTGWHLSHSACLAARSGDGFPMFQQNRRSEPVGPWLVSRGTANRSICPIIGRLFFGFDFILV